MIKKNNIKLKVAIISFICLSILAICILLWLPNPPKVEYSSDNLNIPDQQMLPIIQNQICLDYSILQIKDECSNDFCEVFSSEFASIKDKQKIFIDKYRWILNHAGSALTINAIKFYNSCIDFITISPDGIRIWSLRERQPINFFPVGYILKHAFAYSYPAIVYVIDDNFISKLTLSTQQQETYNRDTSCIPEQFLITDDDKYIIAYYPPHNCINVHNLSDGIQIQSFTGFEGSVKKIIYDKKQGDLVVADDKGIKIFFFQANLPAYSIETLKEYYRMIDKYYSLLEFEELIKDSKLFN
ncbi:hypothetical protein SteCoe_12329 [Stentor coeruleus]|uniref:Uncharacterized protein n=1 Tax=Stentor coeruleus TaxID=5963 RepID=A0A1R2CB18_9CILI|nr:hypothetical protein SteCoe_12329 [Stentor coeruleus]